MRPNCGISDFPQLGDVRFLPVGGSRIEPQHLASFPPLWLHNLVERGIIKDSQQLCLGRCAVGLSDFHRPFLLLSWTEPVAERLPFHIELMLPHGCFDDGFLPIDHPVSDKGESHANARPVFRPVGERAVVHLVVEIERASFESSVVRKQVIDYKNVFERGAELHVHLASVVREACVALSEALPCERSWPLRLIIHNEESGFHRVVVIHCIQRMFPRKHQLVTIRQCGMCVGLDRERFFRPVDVACHRRVNGFSPFVGEQNIHCFLRSDVHLLLGPVHCQVMVLAGHGKRFVHLMRLPSKVSDNGFHLKRPLRIFLVHIRHLRRYFHNERTLLVCMHRIFMDGGQGRPVQPSLHGVMHLCSRHRCHGESRGTTFERQGVLVLHRPSIGQWL